MWVDARWLRPAVWVDRRWLRPAVRVDRRWLAPALTALALGLSPAGAMASCTSTPGDQKLVIQTGGLARTAMIHVPARLPAGKRIPLLLALHGAYGNGPFLERYSGFSKLADSDGFIVAYPSSHGRFWNSQAAAGQPDDVAFLRALIAYIAGHACIDDQRVFAAGVSNGGGMVALAACRLSVEIAAVASVAGDYTAQPPCRPSEPVSLLEIHGTADQVAPYMGRAGSAKPSALPPYVLGWVARDGCSSTPVSRPIAVRTTLYRWGGCAGNVRVEHIRIQGGRHQWPGSTPPDPGPAATICAACRIWSFFAGLPTDPREWSGSGGVGLG